MAISATYSSPVMVNGFACRSCAEMTEAMKNIDPAHPRSGPNGVDAATDPSQSAAKRDRIDQAPAIAAALASMPASYAAHGLVAAPPPGGSIFRLHA